MTERDDEALVGLAKKGDETAFTELIERHQARIYNHALRLMGNSQDAEEVLQDTFLQVFRNLDRFEERSRFSTWVYRIATNEALMKLRKASRRREVSLDDASGPEEWWGDEVRDFAKSALDRVQDKEMLDALERALRELPEEYRVVFTMRDIDGLTNAEVASVLDISVPAVKSRLHRARLFLRNRLTRLFGKGPAPQENRPS